MKAVLIFILLWILMVTSSGVAQQVTGNLEGQILNAAGQPVADAHIAVSSPKLMGTRSAISNHNGEFRILSLPNGTYVVAISHASHETLTYKEVSVQLGKTTRLPTVRLEASVHESVIVIGRRTLIDPISTTLGATLDSDDFAALPLERNYRNIATLLPHANQSFLGDGINFAGATGLENKFFVDGVEVTDPYRGITGTDLPYNFIQEIEVKTGGYEAEYRSSLGAVVNVVTRSGGNEFHGQSFGFFANNRFAGDPRQSSFELREGDFSQYDIGLSIGGPVVRDKLWFSAAYNPTFENEDVEIPGVGFFEDKTTKHIFAGKLNWQAAPKTNVTLTVIGDPATREAVGETFGSAGTPLSFENPDPYLADITTGGVNVLLKGTHVLNEKAFLEASASVITRKEKYLPLTEEGKEPLFIDDSAGGVWSGGYPSPTDDFSRETVVDVKGSVILGGHTLKAGLAYKDNKFDQYEAWNSLTKVAPDFYADVVFRLSGVFQNRIPSLFIQDSWHLSERWRFNAGLRWDGQFLVGSDGKVAQKITDQYQPRIGFSYQPGELGSQRIFGSFGRFYQELSPALSSIHHSEGSLFRFTACDHDPRLDPSGCEVLSESTGEIMDEVDGLEGQHFDEFTLGYERDVGGYSKVSVRGIHRTLRQGIEGGQTPDGVNVYGNPGKGAFSDFPRMRREYTALELTLQKAGGGRSNLIGSYVLSKTWGNYPGLFNSDFNWPFPNTNGSYDLLEMTVNGTGLLPNDRTHVFKLSGAYRLDPRLSVGGSFFVQSGTPINEFGGSSAGPPFQNFIQRRGTAGRTPWIWDLNFRFVYDVPWRASSSWSHRLILDVLHVAGQREPVNFEEIHYHGPLDENGNQTNLNPNYLRPTRFQPPMTFRLGTEIFF